MASQSGQKKEGEKRSWVVKEALEHGFENFAGESFDKIIKATIGKRNIKQGARILDIGCGTGYFTDRLRRMGFEAYGVDISPELIAVAKRKHDPENSGMFLVSDAERLPFKDGSFDACFSGGLIHHFPDIEPVCKEMLRVVKKGGMFFGAEPNKLNWHVFLSMEHSSPVRFDKNTPNEHSISPYDLEKIFTQKNGARLSIEYEFLKMPHEGRISWLDNPFIYKKFGFILKKIKKIWKIPLAVVFFNVAHFCQRFQNSSKKANFIIFSGEKIQP